MIKTNLKESKNRLSQIRNLSRIYLPGIAILLTCAFYSNVRPANSDQMRYRGGLRNSPGPNKLNVKQIDLLLKSLLEKTGFQQMHFDIDGFLQLGDRTNIIGGSATARALILEVVESRKAIDLESDDGSPVTAFARLSVPVIYQSRMTGKYIETHPVRLDFSDFSKLRGDKKVLAAFDIGFVLMHELAHAALGLRDNADDSGEPGECEEYINCVRRELNLPERKNYIARTIKLGFMTARGNVEHAELVFANRGDKPKKYLLNWEALQVGPIRRIPASSIAKTNSTKPVTVPVAGQ